jgi:hypothetical protein
MLRVIDPSFASEMHCLRSKGSPLGKTVIR